jgi:GntR family transcriptional regulator
MEDHQAHLYLQAYTSLREMIEGTEFEPGDRFPSERNLANLLGLCRMTVRRALEILLDEGLLERRSTRGTFVSSPRVVRSITPDSVLSLTYQIQKSGASAGGRLLSFEIVRSTRTIAQNLKLRIGKTVIRIRRLRFINATPICIETSYLPAELVPNLKPEDLQGDAALYEILEKRYRILVAHSDDRISIAQVSAEEAKYLELKEGDAILLLRSVIVDSQERPVEYLISVNHPTRVTFKGIHKI